MGLVATVAALKTEGRSICNDLSLEVRRGGRSPPPPVSDRVPLRGTREDRYAPDSFSRRPRARADGRRKPTPETGILKSPRPPVSDRAPFRGTRENRYAPDSFPRKEERGC